MPDPATRDDYYYYRTCRRCHGDGVVDATPWTWPASPPEADDCPQCAGEGIEYVIPD